MSVDELDREVVDADWDPRVRPIKIRVLQTMNGAVFAAKCRVCAWGNFAYMADLSLAFDAADRHIKRHKELEEIAAQVVQEVLAESPHNVLK